MTMPESIADADREIDVEGLLEIRGQLLDFLDDVNPRQDGPQCILFMRGGIAEVHEFAVTKILPDVTFEAMYDARRARLVPQHDVSEDFGIQLLGEACVVHHVDEHERHVTALGVRGVACRLGDRDGFDRHIREAAPALTAESHAVRILELTLPTTHLNAPPWRLHSSRYTGWTRESDHSAVRLTYMIWPSPRLRVIDQVCHFFA